MAEEMKISNLRLNISFLNDSALLSDEELGRLVRYGLHYIKGDADYAMLKGNEYFLAPVIERYVEEDNERYTLTCENNKRNIQKRWEKNTTVYDRIQTHTNDTNTKSKSNTKSNINKRERSFAPPTLAEVTAYCKERGNGIDPQHFIDYQDARGWVLSNGKKMVDWKATIRTWEQRNKDAVQGDRDPMEDKNGLFYRAVMKIGGSNETD